MGAAVAVVGLFWRPFFLRWADACPFACGRWQELKLKGLQLGDELELATRARDFAKASSEILHPPSSIDAAESGAASAATAVGADSPEAASAGSEGGGFAAEGGAPAGPSEQLRRLSGECPGRHKCGRAGTCEPTAAVAAAPLCCPEGGAPGTWASRAKGSWGP